MPRVSKNIEIVKEKDIPQETYPVNVPLIAGLDKVLNAQSYEDALNILRDAQPINKIGGRTKGIFKLDVSEIIGFSDIREHNNKIAIITKANYDDSLHLTYANEIIGLFKDYVYIKDNEDKIRKIKYMNSFFISYED